MHNAQVIVKILHFPDLIYKYWANQSNVCFSQLILMPYLKQITHAEDGIMKICGQLCGKCVKKGIRNEAAYS